MNTNLIVNGNAESGSAGSNITTPVSSIPGWTVQSGKPTVLPYNLAGYLQLTDPAPPDHGFQYFTAAFPSLPAVMSQTINVSALATMINAGTVEFTASAYLGSFGNAIPNSMAVAFQNASGQTFSTTTLGPLQFPFGTGPTEGMFLQQQIGLVPTGTVQIVVTLSLQDGNDDAAAADSLSLVLSQAGSKSALGTNLLANGNAESGPNAIFPAATEYIPGWSTITYAASVCPYGGPSWIPTTAPGPADRGTNLFCGWRDSSVLYQDVDVSAASTAIDASQVGYIVGAWLGGPSGPGDAATLTYQFFDWTGKQLQATAQLLPGSFNGFQLLEMNNTGTLPTGTRRVRITLNFPSLDSIADDVVFALSAPTAAPVLFPGGIVSASSFGGFTSISPGSWIEIYGDNFYQGTAQQWTLAEFTNNVAPTTVGGVSVLVGGMPAYIDYVSSGQIDALVPSNAPTGATTVTVTNAIGTSDSYPIYVNATQPGVLAPASFSIGGKQYVVALFQDGSFALPANAIPGVASRPAKAGDILTIYGVGFGPVTGGFTAGTIVTAANALTSTVAFQFGSTSATPTYSGLAPSFTGLYQFNVTAPTLSANSAEPFSFTLGGVKGTQTLYIAVQ